MDLTGDSGKVNPSQPGREGRQSVTPATGSSTQPNVSPIKENLDRHRASVMAIAEEYLIEIRGESVKRPAKSVCSRVTCLISRDLGVSHGDTWCKIRGYFLVTCRTIL